MSDQTKDTMLKDSSDRANRANKAALRAVVFPIKKQIEDKTGKSNELSEDPFEQLISDGQVIIPPHDLMTLTMLPEHSSELGPCVDAMVANVDGFGHRFLPRVKHDPDKVDEKIAAEVQKEKVHLENFFAYACMADSFRAFRKQLRKDMESSGNAWFEVIRGPQGDIQGFNHLPCYQMRLGIADAQATLVDTPVLEMQLDNSIEVKTIKAWRRFRRHVQSRISCFKNIQASSGFETRWFKEFGDTRTFNNLTGEEVKGDDIAKMSEGLKASEVIHMKIYCPRSPYGLPRYIGNLLSIFGDRASEEINYITFKNNNIPSMAMLVSNGQLTAATISRISEFVESQIQGSDNYSKFLIVEAEGAYEGEDSSPVKIDIKPLTKDQHSDELFQQYSKNNQDKIRRSFRLPPILVGRCHSSDTEFLTENGWKLFNKIGEDERVASFNASTGSVEYQLPTGRHEYDFDGKLLHLHNRGIDALITPNHRMWTRATVSSKRALKAWDFVEASELANVRGGNGGHLEIPVSGSWVGETIEMLPVPIEGRSNAWSPEKPSKNPIRDLARYEKLKKPGERFLNANAFLKFIGYFVSEGSTTEARGPVTLSQNRGEIAEQMVEVVRELGFEPTVVESREGQLNIRFCDIGIWTWLRENCGIGSKQKKFPQFVLGLSQEQMELALQTAVDGDGSIPELGSDGAFTYTTTSKILADQIQEMCLKLGYASTMRKITPEEEGWSDKWCLYAHRDSRHLLNPSKQISEVDYRGKVACFTVPNGLLITRRNGRVLISGNSDDYTRATADTARRLADEQVFAPERDDFDDMINRIIFPAMRVKYHKYHSNSPNTTDNGELVAILGGAERTGGMTPRIARMILEDVLSVELPDCPQSFPQDVPFSMTMAEAVKNKAQPTEPGQQITALKTIDMLTGTDQVFIDRLTAIQKRLDQEWSKATAHEEHD
jgi:PBSX family phage portal protein